MNPKLVEEVARAICQEILRHPTKAGPAPCYCKSLEGMSEICPEHIRYAQAAIRVCMARAAEIALNHEASAEDYDGTYRDGCEAAADAIKREGGVT